MPERMVMRVLFTKTTGWLKLVAFRNMKLVDTSLSARKLMGWLKFTAPSNILSISNTLLVF